MTHDELLAEINRLDNVLTDSYGMSALFAVVKLHKPIEDTRSEVLCCEICTEGSYTISKYPCLTIQAIEKELK